MKSVSADGSVFTFVNPNTDRAVTFSFDFPTKENADYKVVSTSYGDECAYDAAAGKVTVPANCYVVIATQGVSRVEGAEAEPASGAPEYYNMQGIRIKSPAAGELHIVRKGTASYKAIAE